MDESSDDEVAYYNEFSEVSDPIAAMMWISHMEDVFELMECADRDKVRCAVSVLRSEARVWWEMVKDTMGLETTTKMTWSRFKEVFKEEFYPIPVELELMERFRRLKLERNESVREYTARFEKLWFFWASLTAEKRLIYLYVTGMRADIRDVLPTSCMTTLDSVMEAAGIIDDLLTKRGRRMCSNCGKGHEGECRYGSKECYRCGKLGHLARACDGV